MVSYRHWSVLLWWDPNDVPHRRILPSYEAEWWSVPAPLCWWCCYCLADQLWVLIAYARRRIDVQVPQLCIWSLVMQLWMNEFVFAPSYRDLSQGCCVSIICLLIHYSSVLSLLQKPVNVRLMSRTVSMHLHTHNTSRVETQNNPKTAVLVVILYLIFKLYCTCNTSFHQSQTCCAQNERRQ